MQIRGFIDEEVHFPLQDKKKEKSTQGVLTTHREEK